MKNHTNYNFLFAYFLLFICAFRIKFAIAKYIFLCLSNKHIGLAYPLIPKIELKNDVVHLRLILQNDFF